MEFHNPTLRVIRILELVDKSIDGISLSEISDVLELPKGTISPILKTLSAHNYIKQDGNLYKTDYRMFELGLRYSSGNNALKIIRKHICELVEQVGEICQMGVLRGTDVYYLLRENADTVIQINSNVGISLPAHITGLGKAMLSGLRDDEIRALYDGYKFVAYTPKSIMDVETLIQEVKKVRKTGFAFESEESTPDICCIAIPLEEGGKVKSAISVTIPKYRFSETTRKNIEKLLAQKKKLIEETCFVQNMHMEF